MTFYPSIFPKFFFWEHPPYVEADVKLGVITTCLIFSDEGIEATHLPVQQGGPSSGTIAAIITIALLVSITLSAAVAYYVKRKGILRSSGHHTLTSFENPVYEYENCLK